MGNARFTAWSETRKKGKMKYILINGILYYGLPMFIIIAFFVHDLLDQSEHFVSTLIIDGVGWTVGGALFGLITWSVFEYEYQKECSKRNEK